MAGDTPHAPPHLARAIRRASPTVCHTAARRLAALAVSCALLLGLEVAAPAPAAAQSGRFAVQHFYPSASPTAGFVTLDGGWLLPEGSWEVGLLANTANDPLVVVDNGEERVQSLVSDQTTLALLGAVAPLRWLELGVVVPVVVAQGGDAFPGAPTFDGSGAGPGLGDVRLIPRVQLLAVDRAPGRGGVALALALHTWLPTGDEAAFQGDGGVRLEPRLALEWGNLSGWRLGLDLGYRVRPPDALADLVIDDALTWGVGLEVPLAETVALVLEGFGEVAVLAASIDAEETPVEALLGFEVTPVGGLHLQAGGGTGLTAGFGAPDWRAFLGVSLANLTTPRRDRDDDGVEDDADACPTEPEDRDDFEDDDGCPDYDNDGDGIDDAIDECPDEAEDRDGHVDDDGCPDPDNDWDFIDDAVDTCPDAAEDRDGFEDDDGCWDEALVVVEPCRELTVSDRVYFDIDSAVLQPRAHDLLDQVARVLTARQEIRGVRVEGHTDDQGTPEHNLELSQRRAEAVRDYLVAAGVQPERLEAVGFGDTQPVADNRTREGRQLNRRVTFIITDQEGCAQE